jgi:osmotically-inducible protein OsmY
MARNFTAGATGAGLRASLMAAIAYDEICSGCQIEVALTAQAIVLTGIATPAVARRATEIAHEIAGGAPVWDRMIWSKH